MLGTSLKTQGGLSSEERDRCRKKRPNGTEREKSCLSPELLFIFLKHLDVLHALV